MPGSLRRALCWAGKANYSVWFFYFPPNFCIWTDFNDLCVRGSLGGSLYRGGPNGRSSSQVWGFLSFLCLSRGSLSLEAINWSFPSPCPRGIALSGAGSSPVSPRGSSPCEGRVAAGPRRFPPSGEPKAAEDGKKPLCSVEIEEEEGRRDCGYAFMYIRVYVCRYMYICKLAKRCLLLIPSARRSQGTGRQPGPQGPAALGQLCKGRVRSV